MNNYDIFCGDCLKVMDELIKKGIKVDMILTDPPYGTTACKWDNVIPFDDMWKQINKLIKFNGAIVLFGTEPFSSRLRMSNLEDYRYDWKWDKVKGSNFVNAKKMPLKRYEDICVFYKKQPVYNPQMEKRDKKNERKSGKTKLEKNNITNVNLLTGVDTKGKLKYPTTKLEYNRSAKELNSKYILHPTQKPVELLEYLIKTYTNENEVVLDFTMGSGSTGVACMNTNRNFIGIELDEKYFEIAKNRIEESIKSNLKE